MHPLNAAIATLALGGGLAACSLALPFDAECATDFDCESFGKGLRCADDLCVAVATEDLETAPCDALYGVDKEAAGDPDTILIGSILPKTGQLGVVGLPIERAVALAVDEINSAGGLGGRKLGLVGCDSGSTPDKAIEAAIYLRDHVRVPAIVGPATSSATIETFNQVAHAAGVLHVSPSATSAVITSLQDDDLLWRTAPSDAFQGAALARYLIDQGFERIAIVNRNDAYGTALQETVFTAFCALKENEVGQPWCVTDKDDTDWNILTESYDAAEDESSLQVQLDDQVNAVAQLDAFQPEVTVLIAFVDDGISLMKLAGSEEHGHTRFLLTDGTKDLQLASDLPAEVICPAIGTNPAAPSGEVYKLFESRYAIKWNEPPGVFTAQAYDAAWLIAYAIAAASRYTSVPTGADLAREMKRMSAGEEIRPGLDGWNKAVSILATTGDSSIDYEGASGTLQFDPDLGEAGSSIEAWRINLSKTSDEAPGKVESLGVVFVEDGTYTPPVYDAADWDDEICRESLEALGVLEPSDGG